MAINLDFAGLGHIPDTGWTANGGSVNYSLSLSTTLLVVGATYAANGGAVNIFNSIGSTFNPLTERRSGSGSNDVAARIWYCDTPNPFPAAQSLTFVGSNSFIQGFIFGFRGTQVVQHPYRTESGAFINNGTSIQPGPIPVYNTSMSIIFASFGAQSGINFDSLGESYTLQFNSTGVVGQRYVGGAGFRQYVSNDITNPAWNWTGSFPGVAVMATFDLIANPDFTFSIGAKAV